MSKPFKEKSAVEKIVPPIGIGIILTVFTLYAFVFEQTCDIDKVYLWCRVHPLSVFDVIGLIGFYGGCLVIGGLTPLKLFNPPNSVQWNLIWFAVMAISVVLIWNL